MVNEIQLEGPVRLSDLVEQLDRLSDDATILARQPWSAAAQAMLVGGDEQDLIAQMKSAGFVYFLEVSVSREVMGVFAGRPATAEQRLRLLLHYAEYDAYPDWAYDSDQ